jgi:hypothetical protein
MMMRRYPSFEALGRLCYATERAHDPVSGPVFDMSTERKYDDHEVREIIDLAIGQDDAPTPSLPSRDGLTLGQLQEVGREVGLSPRRIAQAVATFEGQGALFPRTKALGLPTSVGSVLSLPRDLTEREWERLVAEFRTTFGTKGEVTSHGSLREWSYGSLHAFVEPTETGYRLRLTDSFAAPLGVSTVLGGFFLVLGLLVTVILLSREDAGLRFLVGAFMSAGGGGAMALTALSAPRWARRQEQRMEHISRFTAALLAAPEPDE